MRPHSPPNSVKVLIDECCPRAVAEALAGIGFDVLRVADFQLGASDDAVEGLARDQGRIIVTQDYDFGEIAVRQGRFGSGVVLVACPSLPPPERAQRVADVMIRIGERLHSQLTIIELRRVRQRKLTRL